MITEDKKTILDFPKLEKWAYIDIDNTLVFWDKECVVTLKEDVLLSDDNVLYIKLYKENEYVCALRGKINFELLDQIIFWYRTGVTIAFWSGSGYRWVEKVFEKILLRIKEPSKRMVLKTIFENSYKLTKPSFYVDDKDITVWCGERKKPNDQI